MTNEAVVLIYLPFALTAAVLLLVTAQGKGRAAHWGMVFFGNLLGWQVCGMLSLLLRSERAVQFCYALQLAFLAFLPVALLGVIAGLYRVQERFSRRRLLLILVPSVTTILAATSLWQPLLIRDFSIVAWCPLTVPSYAWGGWFYIHTAYSLCLEGLALWGMLRRGKAQAQRGAAGALYAAVILCALATLLEAFRTQLGPLDIPLLLASLGGMALYAAMLSTGRSGATQLQHEEILDYLDELVFILDQEDKIIDCNESAARFLKQMGTAECIGRTFDTLLAELRAKGKIAQRIGRPQAGEGEDLYVVDARFQQVLQMTRQSLAARGGHSEGAFIILEDVTQNRVLIERLHAMTGVDPLTGLPNKYQYRTLGRGLDVPEHLPISVVVCLLDGLHKVNTQLGHERGDEMLKTIAAALKERCPAGGVVARLGGDRFVMLMPRFSGEAARVTIADIQLRLMREGLFQGVLATRWGFATKTRPEENLNTLRMQAERSAQQDPENRGQEVDAG